MYPRALPALTRTNHVTIPYGFTTSAAHTHLHLCTVYTRTNLFIVPYCFNVRVVEDQCKLLAPVFKEDLRRRAMVVTLALLYARDEPGTQRAR